MKIDHKEEGDGKEDVMMISVIDGHCHTPGSSDILRKTLNACLGWAIADQSKTYWWNRAQPNIMAKAMHDA